MAQEPVKLDAAARDRVGKGAARQARREGKIPAVIYGAKKPPVSITIDGNTIFKQYLKGHFTSTVFEINVGSDMHRVIARDLQLDPVRDFPLHVDFMRLAKDALVTVDVPVHFLNESASPGLKRGGVLNIVRHDIPVRCPADKIPGHFDVDLTGIEIGDSIHISSIALPEGVTPTITDRDFTVATVVGRAAEEAPGAAEAEGAEAGAEEGAAAEPAEGAETKKEEKK